jgi:hypothetical protein
VSGIAAALVVFVLIGCSVSLSAGDDEDDFQVPLVCLPEHERLPCAAGVEQGEAYPFNLQTHCGVEWAYFDGRYWAPPSAVRPPSDWAAITRGTMTLEEPDAAVFAGPSGPDVPFVPAAAGYEPSPCA